MPDTKEPVKPAITIDAPAASFDKIAELERLIEEEKKKVASLSPENAERVIYRLTMINTDEGNGGDIRTKWDRVVHEFDGECLYGSQNLKLRGGRCHFNARAQAGLPLWPAKLTDEQLARMDEKMKDHIERADAMDDPTKWTHAKAFRIERIGRIRSENDPNRVVQWLDGKEWTFAEREQTESIRKRAEQEQIRNMSPVAP